MAARDTLRPVMMASITAEEAIKTDVKHLDGVNIGFKPFVDEWLDFCPPGSPLNESRNWLVGLICILSHDCSYCLTLVR